MKTLLVSLLLCCACGPVSDPEPRAQLDLTLGTTSRGGVTWRSDLLALVAERDGLPVFRAACPEFAMTVERDEGGPAHTTFEVRNLMPGTTLRGPPGAVEDEGGERLARRWRVTFPPSASRVELRAVAPLAPGFSFLAFGDIQRGLPRFGDVVERLNAEPDASFIVVMGDLTNSSTPAEFDAVERAFEAIRVPMVITPGNHDAYAGSVFQRRFGRANYTCELGGVRFTSVDSSNAGLSATAWRLYEAALEAGRDQPHVVFSHIPATERFGVRSGHWNSRTEARRFVASTSAANVDLLLFGHLHTLDEYELAGVPTVISGGAGAIEEQFDGIGRHVLKVTLEEGRPRVEVLRVD